MPVQSPNPIRYPSPFAAPRAKHIRQAREAMARVGVQDMAERNFAHLSGGEQQLVLVARALCQQSRILVMDEPTSSLDFGNQLRVLACVRGDFRRTVQADWPDFRALLWARR